MSEEGSSRYFPQQILKYISKRKYNSISIIFFWIILLKISQQQMSNIQKELILFRIINNFKQNSSKKGVASYLILWKELKEELGGELLSYLFRWRQNICLAIALYIILGLTLQPQLMLHDPLALQQRDLLLLVIKSTLIYGLCWILVLTIHQQYSNDYVKVMRIGNNEPYKRLVLFNVSVMVYYGIVREMPVNTTANWVLAVLLLYLWAGQQYVRMCFLDNVDALRKKKIVFLNTFTVNQLISLSTVVTSLMGIIFGGWNDYIKFFPLLPLIWRIRQSAIVGTVEQHWNCLKSGIVLTGTLLSIIGMPSQAYYFRLVGNIYSYYWDIFREWKWNIRFRQRKNYRIDIPLGYFIFGLFATLIGRFLWVFYPIGFNDKLFIELTRRSLSNLLRIQCELACKFPKGQKNKVKDLFTC